ncbi:lactococcin 972 family bacteriocin [Nocardiopsis ganjiahuensis]|uniref:lactococcin 972 family bacteriocin n=1 Tax=Nocardiopsis ganjiahuensis TaxID=239984 RepID=UPI000475F0DF|nr:lactococcin 972 family bacteriocin [Nocardiopsis ganjiahuensis]
MNRAKKVLVTVLVAAGISVGTAGAASAVVSSVGGGTWDRGTVSDRVYSNYLHNSRCHGSTAVGVHTVRSANTGAGNWSRASVAKAWTNNQTYWRNTCG